LKLPVEMQYDLTLAKQAYELAARWDASRFTEDTSCLNFKDSDLNGFNSNQISTSSDSINCKPDTRRRRSCLPPAPSNVPPAPTNAYHPPQQPLSLLHDTQCRDPLALL